MIRLVPCVLLALGGCTVSRMEGFDAAAARGDAERIDVTEIPTWHSGDFRIGTARGHVRRVARGEGHGWGSDGAAPTPDDVRHGVVSRSGEMTFDVAGSEIGGRIEGRCHYEREEARARIGPVDLARPALPLRLSCGYRWNGEEAGLMEVAAALPDRGVAEPRVGVVRLNGVDLSVRSTHRIAGLSADTDRPIGYHLDAPGRPALAVVETNGVRARRLILPRMSAERPAAVAAALTLALFQDPGDVD